MLELLDSRIFDRTDTLKSQFNRIASLWRWSKRMIQPFVDGVLTAFIPSMLAVAWFIWRSDTSEVGSDY